MELRTLEIVANADDTVLEVLEVVDVKDPFTPHNLPAMDRHRAGPLYGHRSKRNEPSIVRVFPT